MAQLPAAQFGAKTAAAAAQSERNFRVTLGLLLGLVNNEYVTSARADSSHAGAHQFRVRAPAAVSLRRTEAAIPRPWREILTQALTQSPTER